MGSVVGELVTNSGSWKLLTEVLQQLGVSWQHVLLAWARVLPLVTIVPAFGSRLMPAPARAVFGLGVALLLVPSVATGVAADEAAAPGALLVLRVLRELVSGLPIALATGGLLWAAMMAGGLVDDLRGATGQQSLVLSDARTPLGALLGLFATWAFLALGGVESALEALLAPPGRAPLLGAVRELISALHITFALAAPIVCVSVVWEVTGALIARAASPAHVQSLLAPLRALVILGGLAVVVPAVFELLVRVLAARFGV